MALSCLLVITICVFSSRAITVAQLGGVSFDLRSLVTLFANVNESGQIAGVRDHDPNKGTALANGQGNRVDPNGPVEGMPGGGRFSIK